MRCIWNRARILLVIAWRHCRTTLPDGLKFLETHLQKICCFRGHLLRWPPAKQKKIKAHSKAPNWKHGTKVSDPPTRAWISSLLETRPELCLLEPFQIFKLLMNDKICDLIIKESKRYAAQHNEKIEISKDESYIFVAIILLSGYNTRSPQRQYWS